MMPDQFERVRQYVQATRMFRRTGSVLAAVSGGPDSVALLLMLQRLAPEVGFTLTVAHFDHQLRPESKRDLEFVRDLCREREIAFLSGEGDVRDTARRQRLGIEETARSMRYQFLSFVAGEKGIDAIATGHTADDQAETVLMRVLRGSGVRGIRGMLPVSTVPGGAQRLVRPLLTLSRADTLAICAAEGIQPLQDASNEDLRLTRNRVRHEVMPLLESLNPAARQSLRRLADNAVEAFEPIEREAMRVQPAERGPAGAMFGLEQLRHLPSEALTLVVEREAAFYRLGADVNATRLRNLVTMLRSGSGLVLFGETAVEVSCGKVRVGPLLEVADFDSVVLNVPGVTIAGAWRVEVSTDAFPAMDGAVTAMVDTGSLSGALRVRPLKPGDRMLFHRIERKVSDVLANGRVPRWDRLSAVAVADGKRVHAILSAAGVFEADRAGDAEDALHVRLTSRS